MSDKTTEGRIRNECIRDNLRVAIEDNMREERLDSLITFVGDQNRQ